ncbi:hypothetical protein KO566_11015 [Flavobacteriaceae bacterium XHP0103]|uniref:hypothetical protein n=1 Tax=Marixanthotalea marina TaxID=2844359 RepID=UPI002989C87D|nr:hypothetical protein [Marixanthotalea marina]MBU3822595.1 hypothetical protein [Marixanthotalea marina]
MIQLFKEHIIFKIVTICLALTLLVPTYAKFAHLFSNHKHDICLGEKSTHLHELNIDCDFYKFKPTTHYTFNHLDYHFFTPKEQPLEVASQYQFISEYQRLQTALRGPPALI